MVTVLMGKFPPGTCLTNFAENVPIGLSFLGEMWEEEKMIGWAYNFEQRAQWRKKVEPVVKPKTQFLDVRWSWLIL